MMLCTISLLFNRHPLNARDNQRTVVIPTIVLMTCGSGNNSTIPPCMAMTTSPLVRTSWLMIRKQEELERHRKWRSCKRAPLQKITFPFREDTSTDAGDLSQQLGLRRTMTIWQRRSCIPVLWRRLRILSTWSSSTFYWAIVSWPTARFGKQSATSNQTYCKLYSSPSYDTQTSDIQFLSPLSTFCVSEACSIHKRQNTKMCQ